MNIYRVIEDGQDFCIKAKTMHEAVKICEECYIEDFLSEKPGFDRTGLEGEREYYHEQILQSCELLGELKN